LAAIALQPDNRQPSFQRAFSVRMGLPKLAGATQERTL
jgi:hypothetical protein